MPAGTTTKTQELLDRLLSFFTALTQPWRSPSVKFPLGTLTVFVSNESATLTALGPYSAAYSEMGMTACFAYCTIWFMSAEDMTLSPLDVWKVSCAKWTVPLNSASRAGRLSDGSGCFLNVSATA